MFSVPQLLHCPSPPLHSLPKRRLRVLNSYVHVHRLDALMSTQYWSHLFALCPDKRISCSCSKAITFSFPLFQNTPVPRFFKLTLAHCVCMFESEGENIRCVQTNMYRTWIKWKFDLEQFEWSWMKMELAQFECRLLRHNAKLVLGVTQGTWSTFSFGLLINLVIFMLAKATVSVFG